MSHLIENTYSLQPTPALKTINKHILRPSLATLASSQSHHNPSSRISQNILSKMFNQFQNNEKTKLQLQNAQQMQKQFQNLRKKLAVKAKRQENQQKQNNDDDSERIWRMGENKKLQLGQILKNNPQGVDIVKKYRPKIREKLMLYKQSEDIVKGKQQYLKWYDSTRNSPTSSPSLSKMTYLIERMHKQNKDGSFNPLISQVPKNRKTRNTHNGLCKANGTFLRQNRYTALNRNNSNYRIDQGQFSILT